MITPERIREITSERLKEWGELLSKNHCTPAILVGVGHDHKSGELHLCTPENCDREFVRGILRKAIELL